MKTAIDRYSFRGLFTGTSAATALIPWAFLRERAEETCVGRNLGGVTMTLGATDQTQNANLYFGDVLAYDIDDLIAVEFTIQTVAALAAASSIVVGMASARNNDPDAVAANAYFKLAGSNALVVESDDGVNDNDDVATGQTLVATWKRFRIEFGEGGLTQSPPTASLGGKADVRFYCDDARGRLRRVADGTRFNMNNYALGLQPYVQLQKTGGAVTDSVSLLEFMVEYKVTA